MSEEKVKVQFGEGAGTVRNTWAGSQDAGANASKLRETIKKAVDGGLVYAVLDVETPSEKKPLKVSGNLLRLSSWLADLTKMVDNDPRWKGTAVKVEVVAYTTDRNEARKQADEV